MSDSFRHVFNLDLYNLKWWERPLLALKPLRSYESDNSILTYKTLGNRLYIYSFTYIVSTISQQYLNYKDN